MALQHLRSSTANKRPTPGAMSDGQLALNTNLNSPGLFFKDSNGDSVKIGPIHVGATAPNATPGAGGQAGNSKGEAWLDTTATNPILKVWNGSAFVAVQPVGTGTVVSTTDTGTVTSTMILDGTILNADVNASAAIAYSKLAALTSANILVGNASNVATSTAVTGDVTISNAGVTAIAAGAIVNADVNASAAIAGTKISPDFGAQNVVTTGTSTAASLIPTSSSVPTNGVYLPAANTVGVATSGSGRITVDGSGNVNIDSGTVYVDAVNNRVGIGTTSPFSNLHVVSPASAAGWQIRTNSSGLDNESGFYRTASDNYELVLRNALGGLSYLTNTGGASTSTLEFIVQGSERARIDTSGRLLVGTSSDLSGGSTNTRFQIAASSGSGISTIAQIYSFNSGGGVAALDLCRSKSTTLGTNSAVANNDFIGSVNFKGANGSSYLQAASISCDIDGTVSGGGANDMPGRLVFSTTADGASSPTERMRIVSSGNVGINRTPAADALLDVNGLTRLGTTVTPYSTAIGAIASANGTTNTGNVALETVSVSSATRFHISFSNLNGVVGSISTSGSATAYNTSSDYRLKENVVDLDGAISRLKLLPVHRFNFIADPDKTVDGFIAHEAAEVVPEAVTGAKDEVDDEGNPVYQGIDQSKLVPLLTAALQEAVAKIESLEARLTAAGI